MDRIWIDFQINGDPLWECQSIYPPSIGDTVVHDGKVYEILEREWRECGECLGEEACAAWQVSPSDLLYVIIQVQRL